MTIHPGVEVGSEAPTIPSTSPIDTGRAFVVIEATTPNSTPQKCTSIGQVEDIFGAPDADSPDGYNTLDVAFRSGLAEAWVIGLTDVAATNALEAAAGGFPRSLGCGQLLVPDASELTDATQRAEAQLAVIEAAAGAGRTALVQLPRASVTDKLTAAGALRTNSLTDEVAGVWGSWITVPGRTPGSQPRTVPMIAAMAGLIARTDRRFGNAGHMAAGDQTYGIGDIGYALGLAEAMPTDSQWDSLTAAGVNLAVTTENGTVQNYGFRSLSSDNRWKQLNWHRLRMQILAGGGQRMKQVVFQIIDGEGKFFARVNDSITDYLTQLWQAGVLFGRTAAEAFSVDTSYGPGKVNTPALLADGETRAVVEYTPSPGAERVRLTIISRSLAEAA